MNHRFDELSQRSPHVIMRRAGWRKCGVALAWIALASLALAGSAKAAGPTFTSFDYPGAVFTDGVDINRFGDIVGHYIDAAGVDHGYLLHNGVFTTVDYPGADGGHAHGINSAGVIVGLYFTGKKFHGYVLNKGVYTTVDFPGAQNTRANGINRAGDIVGSFVDNNSYNNTGGSNGTKEHGFLYRGGVFTPIDFPGASYTEAWRINDHGQVLGRYQSGNGGTHVFLFAPASGSFISLDYPGASSTAVSYFTQMGGLNNNGDIVSDYCSSADCDLDTVRGFLLSGGSFVSLEMPGAAGTVPFGINDQGVIVGGYTDSSLRVHGFLRTPN